MSNVRKSLLGKEVIRMNILIVTPFYKQDKNIASVRWTNFAQRLAKNHKVFVVSQPYDDMDMIFSVTEEDGIVVARCNQKTVYEKIAIKYFAGETGDDWQTTSQTTEIKKDVTLKEPFNRKIKNKLIYKSMKHKANVYAKKICETVIPRGSNIDVVITSACPFIEILFGYELKKRLDCKWICDFRDLPYFYDDCDNNHRMKRIMKKMLPSTDGIFVVVAGMKDFLVDELGLDQTNIHVITNGFSKSDEKNPIIIDDDILHIVHTGSLYGGKRKADLLFKAINAVHNTHPHYKFILECAGGNSSFLVETAKQYELENSVKDYGFISREKALELQNQSDCLLLLVENQPGGVLSGKVFEYLLCNKPIISISCGEIPDCAASDLIEKLNVGIATEEPREEEDVLRLADYLLKQSKRKISKEGLEFKPNKEAIDEYDYDNLTKRIELICCQITEQK